VRAAFKRIAEHLVGLKNIDMTDLRANMFLRLPENTIGGETP
jgi:hypothetical protein